MNGEENRQDGSWHFQQELWRERKSQFPNLPKQPKEILSVVQVWKEEKNARPKILQHRSGEGKTKPFHYFPSPDWKFNP